MGVGISLVCGLAIPPHCCLIVSWHPLALAIYHTEVELGLGEPLIRGLAVPPHCCLIVSRYALALAIYHTQVELGHNITPFRRF